MTIARLRQEFDKTCQVLEKPEDAKEEKLKKAFKDLECFAKGEPVRAGEPALIFPDAGMVLYNHLRTFQASPNAAIQRYNLPKKDNEEPTITLYRALLTYLCYMWAGNKIPARKSMQSTELKDQFEHSKEASAEAIKEFIDIIPFDLTPFLESLEPKIRLCAMAHAIMYYNNHKFKNAEAAERAKYVKFIRAHAKYIKEHADEYLKTFPNFEHLKDILVRVISEKCEAEMDKLPANAEKKLINEEERLKKMTSESIKILSDAKTLPEDFKSAFKKLREAALGICDHKTRGVFLMAPQASDFYCNLLLEEKSKEKIDLEKFGLQAEAKDAPLDTLNREILTAASMCWVGVQYGFLIYKTPPENLLKAGQALMEKTRKNLLAVVEKIPNKDALEFVKSIDPKARCIVRMFFIEHYQDRLTHAAEIKKQQWLAIIIDRCQQCLKNIDSLLVEFPPILIAYIKKEIQTAQRKAEFESTQIAAQALNSRQSPRSSESTGDVSSKAATENVTRAP
jgi:hypothetical protein